VTKRLYRVTVEREMLVFAEDEDEAVDIAQQNERDEDPHDVYAALARDLYAHEAGSLVWHAGEDDITAEDALAASPPPECPTCPGTGGQHKLSCPTGGKQQLVLPVKEVKG
jgi:hypothetical protein